MLTTPPKKRPATRLATLGIVLSAVALLVAPVLVVIGFFLGIFEVVTAAGESPTSAASFWFPDLGVWGFAAFAVTLPGLLVSFLALQQTESAGPARTRAFVGLGLGAVALLSAASVAYSFYGAAL